MIRRGKVLDVKSMARIYMDDLRSVYADILPEEYFVNLTEKKAQKIWREFFEKEDSLCLIYEEGGSVLGFASIRPDEENDCCLQLSALYVGGCVQGRGIGRTLISEAMKETMRNGKHLMSISVVLENVRAKKIYEHMGAKYEKSFVYYFDRYPIECGRYIWTLSF